MASSRGEAVGETYSSSFPIFRAFFASEPSLSATRLARSRSGLKDRANAPTAAVGPKRALTRPAMTRATPALENCLGASLRKSFQVWLWKSGPWRAISSAWSLGPLPWVAPLQWANEQAPKFGACYHYSNCTALTISCRGSSAASHPLRVPPSWLGTAALSWSGLSRPSIQSLAPALVDGWILGTGQDRPEDDSGDDPLEPEY